MICCLNPRCNQENPSCREGTEHCTSCGQQLVLLFDRYRPIRRMGTGESAVTYFAQDKDAFVNKDCVIKQLLIQNPEVRELAEREAQKLHVLSNKTTQVPKILDYQLDGEYLYLVQWFVDGENLDEYLTRHGAFSEDETVDFMNSLLPLLELIHKQKIIHRDLKLENIIRRSNGELVLTDFGIGKQSTGNIFENTAGTPGYTAFEQTEQGLSNPASDLYSLGAACFHLLTGKHPNVAFQESEYGWTHRWQEYLPQTISNDLSNIIDKLLQKNYRDRYQSARNVSKDLNVIYRRSVSKAANQHRTQNLSVGSIPRNSRSRVGRNSGINTNNPQSRVGRNSEINTNNSQSRFGGNGSIEVPRENTWLNFNTLLFGGVVVGAIVLLPTIQRQYRSMNPARAIEDYTQAINTNPADIDAYANRGDAHSAVGNKKEAFEDYTQAINLNPEDANIYFQRGNVRANSNDKQGAIEDYTQAITLKPDEPDVYSKRGNAYSAIGNKKEAIEDFTQVITLKPDRLDAYFHRAIDRANIGDRQGALEDYTQVIKLDPNRADAYFDRGNVRSGLGDKQGAIEDLTKSIDLKSDRAAAYKSRGNARAAIGDKKGASDDYEQATKLSKK
jgi:serine/threonine protein kinase/lipoprotein NlpI